MHPIEELFDVMSSVEPYPAGVMGVPSRIPGVAFFPGGAGLWGVKPGNGLPPMPIGGIMVLGHDFHSEEGFRASLAQGTEVPAVPRDGYRIPPTWLTLQRLLSEAAVPLESCFFTNAYMGLRTGSNSLGRFPGSRDASFVARCQMYFLLQLKAQRPSVVLTLGSWVPSFVAPLAPQLSLWRGVQTMKSVDAAGPLVHEVEFERGAGTRCTVVALTHPSLRGPNVVRRKYRDLTGHAAELAMLREAASTAGMRSV